MIGLGKDVQLKGISSAWVISSFYEGKFELESKGYQIISLEQNAKLRVHEGKNAYVSQTANWVREGFLYIPNRGKFLTKNSPIMAIPIDSPRASIHISDFYLTNEQVEQGLFDSIKLKDKSFSIPTKRFGEDEFTVYAFGNSAQNYGTFLEETGRTKMRVQIGDIGNKPFVKQAYFLGLPRGNSELSGVVQNFNGEGILRGIRND